MKVLVNFSEGTLDSKVSVGLTEIICFFLCT